MPVKIFMLRNVPDDEADDIRELLTNHGLEYFETPPGNWGISSPAIWLNDETLLEKARSLIDTYQHERSARIREEYSKLKLEGKHRTLLHVIRENPIRFLLYVAAIVVIIYLSTKPFLDFGK